MITIESLVNSKDEQVSQIGKTASLIVNAYKQNAITQQQYEELVNDLLDIKKIEKLAKTAEQKAFLHEVFEGLKVLLKVK